MAASAWPKALKRPSRVHCSPSVSPLPPEFLVPSVIPAALCSRLLSPVPSSSSTDLSQTSHASRSRLIACRHSDFARGSFSLRIKVEVRGKKVSIRLFHANEIAPSRARSKLSRFRLMRNRERIHRRARDKKLSRDLPGPGLNH